MKNWAEIFRGLRLPTEIDPKEFGVDLRTDKPIDVAEASVYAGKRKVVKVYDGFMAHLINWWVLNRYQVLTSAIDRVVRNNEELAAEFGFGLRVVPIEIIGVVAGRSKLCSVSQFVPGKNLAQLGFQSEEMSVMIDRFARLNEILQQRTKEPAVRVDFTNAKFDESGKIVIVTDVCGVIASLNREYYNQPAYLG